MFLAHRLDERLFDEALDSSGLSALSAIHFARSIGSDLAVEKGYAKATNHEPVLANLDGSTRGDLVAKMINLNGAGYGQGCARAPAFITGIDQQILRARISRQTYGLRCLSLIQHRRQSAWRAQASVRTNVKWWAV